MALLNQAIARWLSAGLTSTMSLLFFHPGEEEIQPWDEVFKGIISKTRIKGVVEVALSLWGMLPWATARLPG